MNLKTCRNIQDIVYVLWSHFSAYKGFYSCGAAVQLGLWRLHPWGF